MRLLITVLNEEEAINEQLFSVNTNRFNEQVTGYDKMGNILGLKRYGQTSSTGYDVIDDLSFELCR